MKPGGFIHSLGVRARVLILAVLPVATVVGLLGYHLASSRLEDANKESVERGALIARNLALASEFALFSQNTPLLRDTLQRVANEPEVLWAGVWDAERRAMVAYGVGAEAIKPGEIAAILEGGNRPPAGLFFAPIRVSGITLTDFIGELAANADTAGPASSQLLGHAVIRVTEAKAMLRRSQIVSNSIVIALAALFGSALLALLIGNSITEPVMRVLNTVRDIHGGNLNARVRARAGGEIGDLEQGLNEMAENLQRVQQDLEDRIQEATGALRVTVGELEMRNEELEQARQIALHAGLERTQFLARMSHEIRTPLNAVVGFAKLLEANTRPESNEEHLRTIQLAAEQLLHVINDILQFIRLDAGADRLESLPFSITDLLEDVVAMLGPAAGEKRLDLVLLLHSDLPGTMQGDPSRLSQIVVNLVNNAIKFTARGHVLVEASRLPAPRPGAAEAIEITVEDTGIGLNADERREIFAAFSQSDSSITRRFGGTGLGLAITKQLCRLMDGDITVKSTKGEGSVFTVRLPCVECSAPAEQQPQPALAGKRVLLYDVNPIMRRSLRNTLATWGLQVFNTGRWEKMLSLLRDSDSAGPFDFLILSLTFDEQNPASVAAYLRQARRHFSGAILLLTGSEEGIPPASGHWDAKIAWASKPIRRSTLLRRLTKGLGTGGDMPAQVPQPKPRPLRLSGLLVLVAEDNSLNRQLLHHLLAQEGARMDEVASGQEAIEAAAEHDYDAILMDLHMPEVDGIEAARRIRALLDERVPPIIALTADVFGRNDQEDAEECFDDWLLKPADPEQLTRVLLKHCRPAAVAAQEPGAQRSQAWPLPAELRGRYRQEITEQIGRLGEALAANDSASASLRVHDLKGLVGVYHDPTLNQLVQQLEHNLQDDDDASSNELLTALRSAVEGLSSDTDTAGGPA